MEVQTAAPLLEQLKTRAAELDAIERQSINDLLFLPADPLPRPLDFCVILGSRRCEYRVQAALEHCGRGAHWFIVSGGGIDDAGRTEAQRMREYLEQREVGADQIVEEPESRHTRENLVKTRELLDRLGYGQKPLNIVLVTGGFHLRRTAWLLAEEWSGRSQWRVAYCPAYGPHTHPERWHESAEGRDIIGRELAKVSAMAGVADRA